MNSRSRIKMLEDPAFLSLNGGLIARNHEQGKKFTDLAKELGVPVRYILAAYNRHIESMIGKHRGEMVHREPVSIDVLMPSGSETTYRGYIAGGLVRVAFWSEQLNALGKVMKKEGFSLKRIYYTETNEQIL